MSSGVSRTEELNYVFRNQIALSNLTNPLTCYDVKMIREMSTYGGQISPGLGKFTLSLVYDFQASLIL